MARKINRLSATSVRNAKTGMHADGGGLYLQVTDTGAKSWLFRYSNGERERYCGLGGLSTVSLSDARDEAQRCRQQRLKGIDPIEARKAARSANALAASQGTTFQEAAEELIASKSAGWKKAKHARRWRQSLKDYAYPVLGPLAVSSITTDHLLKVLKPIWTTKPETAGRVRARIEAVLDAFRARNHEMNLGANPARWKGHLDHWLGKRPKAQHFPALPYDQIGVFMPALRARQESIAGDCLEFTILTAARYNESTGARVGEIDFTKAEWRVPADRMKMTMPHVVPLSPRALAIAQKHAEGKGADALLFPNEDGGQLTNSALTRVHRGLGDYRDEDGRKITTHGFRSTFRDWAGDCTNYPREIAEFALAHVVGDDAEAAYRRSTALEKRRELMKAWADYCDRLPADTAKVIPIRARA